MTEHTLCHEGNVKVIQIDNTTIWAGGSLKGCHTIPGALHIALGEPSLDAFSALNWTPTPPLGERYLLVNWPDMYIPRLTYHDWLTLVQLIRAEENVLLYCQGGHGRTGTALSILCSLMGFTGWERCPVTRIRNLYCKFAVETSLQLHYIKHITREEVSPKVAAEMWINHKAFYKL